MSTFANALADVFDRGAELRLSEADEVAAIADVRAGGSAGLLALVYAYAPLLRGQVARFRDSLDSDEAQSVAVGALVEAAHAAENPRIAGIARDYVAQALASAADAYIAVTIPERTAKRFFGILRRAEGDVEAAAALAPAYQMSRETFFDCLRALRTEALDEPTGPDAAPRDADAVSLWEPAADAEDRVLVEMAFAAVDELETDICRLAYGFADYDPQPDAEVADRLGLGRATVQRRRTGALVKMRDALGA